MLFSPMIRFRDEQAIRERVGHAVSLGDSIDLLLSNVDLSLESFTNRRRRGRHEVHERMQLYLSMQVPDEASERNGVMEDNSSGLLLSARFESSLSLARVWLVEFIFNCYKTL